MAYSHTRGKDGIAGLFDEYGNSEINMLKCLKIHIDHAMFDGVTETVIHAPLPRAIIDKVVIDVTTAEATATTKTIDVGTATADGGDPDGFIDGASTAAIAAILGAGSKIGTIMPASDRIVATLGEGASELVADIYIFYTEI
jgi:hypothetical protein